MKYVSIMILSALLLCVGFTLGTTTTVTVGETVVVTPTASPNPTVMSKSMTIKSFKPDPDTVVHIDGPIMDNAADIAKRIQSVAEKQDEVYLLINSPGGSVLDGALILSAMESSSKPVYTVCMEICASMAAIIHQYGKQRLMVNRSILMFHDASAGLGGDLPTMRTRLNFLERYTQKMDAYIAKRSGRTLEQFNKEFSKEKWIDGASYEGGYIFSILI